MNELVHDLQSSHVSEAGMARTWMQRWRRYLGWSYLLLVHVIVVVLIIDPTAMQRLKRYLCHDPSVAADYQGMVGAQTVVCAGMPDGAVIFLGDSRMRDLPVREVVDKPAINLSIGGDTTKGLLGRLGRYPRLESARVIVVGIGVNDLSHFDNNVVLENFARLLRNLNALGPRIVVSAILHLNEEKYGQSNATYLTGQKVANARIDAVNRAIHDMSRQYSNSEFVDVNSALTSENGNLRDEFSADGIHLTAAGNTAWAVALKSELARTMK
jgi:lysophospholipase L1-like esterase